MVSELSERAAAVHSGVVDPSVSNMLKITSDGRKLGLDQRLMNPLLPDDPNSKLNVFLLTLIEMGLFAAAVGAGGIMELMERLCECVEDVLTV